MFFAIVIRVHLVVAFETLERFVRAVVLMYKPALRTTLAGVCRVDRIYEQVGVFDLVFDQFNKLRNRPLLESRCHRL